MKRELALRHPFVPAALELLKYLDKSNTTAALRVEHGMVKKYFPPPKIYSIS